MMVKHVKLAKQALTQEMRSRPAFDALISASHALPNMLADNASRGFREIHMTNATRSVEME